MLAALSPIIFDQPGWLLLLLLIIPAYLVTRRSIGGLSRRKAYVTFTLRSLLIAILAVAMAEPIWVKRGEGLTVTIVLDRSQSIPIALKQKTVSFLNAMVREKERPEDRVAVVTVGKDANIAAMARPESTVAIGSDEGDLTATNLAEGVRLALATMPDDTSNRILLVSDGNETVDSVMAAADLARASNVPIDILRLDYDYPSEVLFEQIVAPARARQGQTADIKLVLRSQSTASGTIKLRMNGEPLDLNGAEPGEGMAVTLDPGVTAISQTISLDESGPHQFEAVFTPDDTDVDAIIENNTAHAVTFVGGKGKVLIVDDGQTQSQYLLAALNAAGITVDVADPGMLAGGLVFLSGYDAVVLVNIPKWALSDEQDRMLHAYVHDLGGGLLMIGGRESFGAGGWIDSELAKVLPVKLNPPQTRQMPSGALALIMHSCEMPQGNYWGQKVAESAIKALSRLDYAGIVVYGWNAGGGGGINGCTWAFPMQRLGDKQAALAATKQMNVGDMPTFDDSLKLALQGLTSVNAAQRHAIIISDGDAAQPSAAVIQSYIDNRTTITAVMVGGHGTPADLTKMNGLATKTGGRFYNIKNPKQLPQIFIKEARLISRSLIQDGDVYQPSVTNQLPHSPTAGFSAVPAVDGYVLTAPRDGLAQSSIIISTEDGQDPLFAYWNYGLGRSAAYTSDVSNLWGARWASWNEFQSFWEQVIRWALRPSAPSNMLVSTRVEGDMAIVDLEALDANSSYLNFVNANAIVVRPDAGAMQLPFQQTGPGRYRTQFQIDDAGAYLVNVAFQGGTEENPETHNLPAAITVPYAQEFRSVTHNGVLMENVMERTNGRSLSLEDDVKLVSLFDREGLDVARSPKPVWDFLAILAAILLIFDVAARRLSVNPERMADAARQAVQKRGEASEATVAAWKRSRSQVAHRREGRASRDKASARYEASDEDAQRAIDVGAKDAAESRPLRPAPGKPAAAADDDQEAGSHTSRLLAAKRRAQRDEESASEDGEHG